MEISYKTVLKKLRAALDIYEIIQDFRVRPAYLFAC